MLCAFLSPLSVSHAGAQADTLTCDDFTNQDAAQIVADLDNDFAEVLDEDGDGEACPDLPAREDNGGGSSADVELLLGTDIDDFEEAAGVPEDDADEDDFSIGTEYAGFGDFDSVHVFWLNDTAAHITVELSEELELEEALAVALELAPSDIVPDTEGEDLEGGEFLFGGESDEVAELFTDADYEEFEVGGQPGDVRVILIPGDEGVAAIDVAIGTGDEFVSTGGGGGGTDDPVDADVEEYLATVRDAQIQMSNDIIDFSELIANAANWSDADITNLTDILVRWGTIESEASALEVPDGMEDIQAAYEDAATSLGEVSVNLTAFITEEDDAALDVAFASLGEAAEHLTTLDTLLTDAGA
jgi:hypothetical protein